MFTILSRIIHLGFKNFRRNGLLSTATVAITTLCLLVFAGLLLGNVVTDTMINFLKDKIDISVYFKTDSPEDEILSMKSSLEKLSEVKSVEYISRDQALAIFKEKHQNDQSITQSLNELGVNPLEASLNIKAHEPDRYVTIAKYLEAPSLAQYIDNVSYSKNQVIINRLVGIVNTMNRAGLILTILLSLVAGLVIFNTIRLAIYSNRDEISIMRVVGASNALVRGPYVVQGIMSGAFAALFSIVLIILMFLLSPLVISSGTNYFDLSVPGFNLSQYFYSHILLLLGYQLLFGIGIASLSSFIAVRRYLRN